MRNVPFKSLYYILTYSLCIIAAFSIQPLMRFWYFVFFAIICAWGMFFSANTQEKPKERVRFFIGIFLIIVSIIFWFKFPLDRSSLPHLMLLFLLIIALSSFTIRNAFHLSVVHFESLFLIVFSACLPFSFPENFRALLLFSSLFVIILLLQITPSKAGIEEIEEACIFNNINIPRRLILTLFLTIIIAFASGWLIRLVPKFSISLNLDRRGSSVVDFKVDNNGNLSLMLNEKGEDHQIANNKIIPYARSLFLFAGLRKKEYKKEDDWKQPRVIEPKIKERDNSGKTEDSGHQAADNNYGGSSEDKNLKGKSETVGGDSPKEKDALSGKIKILKADIAKTRTLYRLLSSFGEGDPDYKKKLKALAGEIKEKKLELESLAAQVDQAKLNKNIDKSKEYARSLKTDNAKGKHPSLLALNTAGANKVKGDMGSDRKGLGGEKQTEETKDDIGAGENKTDFGTGEGQSENSVGSQSSASAGDSAGSTTSDRVSNESGDRAGSESGKSIGNEPGKNTSGESNESAVGDQSTKGKKGKTNDSPGGEPKGSQSGKSGKSSGNGSDGRPSGKSDASSADSSASDGDAADKSGQSSSSKPGDEKGGLESEAGAGPGEGNSNAEKPNSDNKSKQKSGGAEDTGTSKDKESADNKKSIESDSASGGGQASKRVYSKSLSEGQKDALNDHGEKDASKAALRIENKDAGKFKKDNASLAKNKALSDKRGSQPANKAELNDTPKAKKKSTTEKELAKPREKHSPLSLEDELPEEKKSFFEKIRENRTLFFLICFFAIIFVCGILYLSFCLIRKLILDLKMNYLYFYNPKQLIVKLYHNLRFVFIKTGQKAKPHLTPKEIAEDAAVSENYSIRKELGALTEAFIKARYSNNNITGTDVNKCITAYNDMKHKMAETSGFKENIFLKLNMSSLIKKKINKKQVNSQ